MPLKVVIAEDVEDHRVLIRYILAETTTIVGEAADGEEALAVTLRERPDVVVTDMLMPLLNGIELAQKLKQVVPQTKVVVLTAYTGAVYQRLAFAGGADAFVSKGALSRDLLPAIRDVVAGRQPSTPADGQGPRSQPV